ncbi:hypothetical protein ACFFUE_10240 [Bergeyella porcorum]|uniref:hypothetical protein n=1 Tax=Bergeyella porcorum TaxID=1735111 RepID=UPI0035EC2AB5
MSKITIKHFLNTNLKPYVINKQNYYTIYVLITAKRRTTKLKSLMFDEYYTENDFEEIFNSENSEDIKMIENEISSINIISEIIISELQDFDTAFLTAFINFSNTIDIWKIDNECFRFDNKETVNIYHKNANSAGMEIDTIKIELSALKTVTLYDYFNRENQTKAKEILKKQGVKNIPDVIQDINKSFFYRSLDAFEWYIKGSKKNMVLKDKYENFFDMYNDSFDYYMINKYATK